MLHAIKVFLLVNCTYLVILMHVLSSRHKGKKENVQKENERNNKNSKPIGKKEKEINLRYRSLFNTVMDIIR